MIKNFEELFEKAKKNKKVKLVVIGADDINVLKAIIVAEKNEIIESILIGDVLKINQICTENDLDVSRCILINILDVNDMTEKAMTMINLKEADLVMKGLIETSTLLKAVLNKKFELFDGKLLSHVMVYQIPTYKKLLFLTDGGMNISPVLNDKIKITENAILVAKAMGYDMVKIAGIAAKEKVNEKMIATVDAKKIEKLSKEGLFDENVIFEGPLALDVAVSEKAAKIKGVDSKVSGDVDILLVPTIEVGNSVGKTLTYFANAKSAGVIMGAKMPIILVSRADSFDTKLNAIALGSIIASDAL